MKQLILKQDVKPIVYSLFVSLVVGYLLNILVLIAVMIAGTSGKIGIQVLNEIAILVSLVSIPYVFYTRVLNYKLKEINKKKMIKAVFFELMVGLGLLCVYELSVVVHFMIIAVAEEIHFRVLQYEFLEEQVGVKKAILISSVIFAFILHMNDPILGNLFIRLPLGIALCLIKYKYGVNKSIAAHWIYDVVVSMV